MATSFKEVTEGGFMVSRDEDGKVKPIEGVTPTLSLPIKLRPLTYGQTVEYPSFHQGILTWSHEDQAKIIRDCVIECDGVSFEDLTEEDLKGMEAWAIQDVLQAIMLYSGFSRLFVGQAKKEGLIDEMGNLLGETDSSS